MPAGTDYIKLYGKANAAYCQGRLDEALELIAAIISDYPDDGNSLLLRGHIYLKQAQYEQAREQYESVLRCSDQPELIDYAHRGIGQINLAKYQAEEMDFALAQTEGLAMNEPAFDPTQEFGDDDDEDFNWGSDAQVDALAWDSGVFNELSEDDLGEPTVGQAQPYGNPFAQGASTTFNGTAAHASHLPNDPFGSREVASEPSYVQEDEFPFFDDEAEENGYPDHHGMAQTGESTFVVSSDLRGASLGSGNPGSTLLNKHQFKSDFPSSQLADGGSSFDDFSDFDDEDADLSQLDITDVAQAIPGSALLSRTGEKDFSSNLGFDTPSSGSSSNISQATSKMTWSEFHEPRESPPIVVEQRLLKPKAEVPLGPLAPLKNAKLATKQLMIATAAGVTPMLAIFLLSTLAWLSAPKEKAMPPTKARAKTEKVVPAQKNTSQKAVISPFSPPIFWMMLLCGFSGFGITWLWDRSPTVKSSGLSMIYRSSSMRSGKAILTLRQPFTRKMNLANSLTASTKLPASF